MRSADTQWQAWGGAKGAKAPCAGLGDNNLIPHTLFTDFFPAFFPPPAPEGIEEGSSLTKELTCFAPGWVEVAVSAVADASPSPPPRTRSYLGLLGTWGVEGAVSSMLVAVCALRGWELLFPPSADLEELSRALSSLAWPDLSGVWELNVKGSPERFSEHRQCVGAVHKKLGWQAGAMSGLVPHRLSLPLPSQVWQPDSCDGRCLRSCLPPLPWPGWYR